MTSDERREAARLRSERWRRARGIGPRKPAQRPWLAVGISRSTWYRRRAKARSEVALAVSIANADYLARQLANELQRCALAHAVMARELAAWDCRRA